MNETLLKPGMTQKPSGSVTYNVETGANVWPGTDRAYVRELNGQMVIFQEYRDDDKVAVSVGGRDRILPRSEWRVLSVYRR